MQEPFRSRKPRRCKHLSQRDVYISHAVFKPGLRGRIGKLRQIDAEVRPVRSVSQDLHVLRPVQGVDDVLLDLLIFYVIQGIDVDGLLKDLLKVWSDGRQRKGDDRKAGLVARDILVHHRHGQIPVFQEQPLLLFCEGPGLFLIDRRKAFLSKGLHHSRSGVFCGFLFVLLIGSL